MTATLTDELDDQLGLPVPQAVDAENAVLGAMLISDWARPRALGQLSADDFYRPQNRTLFATIAAMTDAGVAVDALTVYARLAADGLVTAALNGSYVHGLAGDVVTAQNVDWHADQVKATARRRRIMVIGQRLTQAAASPSDDDRMLDSAAQSALQLDLLIDEKTGTDEIPDLHSWRDFIDANRGQHAPWVLPGVVRRQDVWMILAPPGAGKTTLSRQVCLCLAAGVHPFTLARIEPVRTLMVDLETDPSQAADETDPLLAQVARLGDFDDDRAHVWSHIEGLNLRKREDRQLFERVLDRVRPEFVAFGSLYKAGVQARAGESYEVAANEVREALDQLRRRWRCALWIEHHMPKAQGGGSSANPFGSSVWQWWPSHGRILERAGTSPAAPFRFSAPFRGDRGKRDAPVGFTRGGRLPWTAIEDDAELDLLIEATGGTT